MRSISQNPITQGKHGAWNAVDISAKPDSIAYAPEDVTFVIYAANNGDCGNALTVRGASGDHGFCHLEGEPFIKPGQTVKKGSPLFKMGYTGKTIPVGEGGRHAHWILRHNGAWVYPPDLINEPFKKGEDVSRQEINQEELDKICWLATGLQAKSNPNFQNNLGNPLGKVLENFMGYSETRNLHLDAEAYRAGQVSAPKVTVNGTPYVPEEK